MEQSPSTENRERIVSGSLFLLGIQTLIYSQVADNAAPQPMDLMVGMGLALAIILLDHFPIHLLRGTKVSLINLPIFISTAILPAPVAIFSTGVGMLVSELLARNERGLLPRDIIYTVGQWMVIVFLGSRVTMLIAPMVDPAHGVRLALLFTTGLVFLLSDFLIFSISQSFIYKEPFLIRLKLIIREASSVEITQYLMAIIGSLAADQDRFSLLFLIVPLAVTYVAFKNLKETRLETIQILEDMADTVDLRDVYTGGHSKRVADLVRQILNQLQVSGLEATTVEVAARLHDIGKIGIPDVVLKKPTKLSPYEMDLMRTHSEKGAELLSKYRDFSRGASMVLHHHERWDGHGYPGRLKGHEIPFGARVIAVADSFDAMTSDRPYRKALSIQQALHVLRDGSDKQWDGEIVSALIDVVTRQITDKTDAIEPSRVEPVFLR